MELTKSAEERAQGLLERMRETPMRRGGLSKRARELKRDLARAIAGEEVPPILAQRIALQLVLKVHRRGLLDQTVWRAVGRILHRETLYLREYVGLSHQRVVKALPKLSATQVAEFLDELTKTDRTIARTILHAAINTAEPLAAGRRYLAEYHLVAQKLRAIDPTMARTVAAATFSACAPLDKALQHLKRFSSLMTRYQDQPQMARRLARAGYRARPGVDEPKTVRKER